jgi:hypothetical protein
LRKKWARHRAGAPLQWLMPLAEERPLSLSVTKDEVLRLARECRQRAARIQSDQSRDTYLKAAAAWERIAREATLGDAAAGAGRGRR